MYYNILIKVPFKVDMINVFTNEKKAFEFTANQTISGRIDKIGGNTVLLVEEEWGGNINEEFVAKQS